MLELRGGTEGRGGMTDPRPTQAEVEAKAAEMFGADWKDLPQRQIRWGESYIADRLDKARAVVIRERER